MPHTTLFESGGHRNILFDDFAAGGHAVQANQHLIVHNGAGMILDPGGHKVYSKVLAATFQTLGGAKLKYIFLSHQDPDIVAATNGWLMTTDATAYVSALWTRFVPHFGLDSLVEKRLLPIPDEGMKLDLGGQDLLIVPAHYLHSSGNFHVYDPISKILYTGDLGASINGKNTEVADFDAHIPAMEGFHKRYMASTRALRAWVRSVRGLDISIIAPQHGQYFTGANVKRFLDWCDSLECGIELLEPIYKIPS
ncbi:MAG: MBL fold metallo-hydrolase [Polyangiaceae bacterium]|nr:MBL fold metallo-hydrolase [Polyangiaceae bacterium]